MVNQVDISDALFTPEHIKRWALPDSYAGPVWPDYYVACGQHRDSDSLTRSNFTCILKALGGESETVIVIRERHWAVGWVEWIGIHEGDSKALQIADDITERLDDYPVVNEDHWSNLEYEEACDFWESLNVAERLHYCQRAGVSSFAARHAYFPEGVYDLLIAA